jgi:hypothetical protein
VKFERLFRVLLSSLVFTVKTLFFNSFPSISLNLNLKTKSVNLKTKWLCKRYVTNLWVISFATPIAVTGLQETISNYWMRLSMISRIIQTEVIVICRSEAEADNIDRGLKNSWYHAKAESNNCFIIHLKTLKTWETAQGFGHERVQQFFFWMQVRSNGSIQKNNYWTLMTSSAENT